MASHNDLGKLGEEIAIDFLQRNEYKIIETNWRFQKAEIDIIAQQNEILAIVEVKTRSSKNFGDPQDFVTPKKIKLLTLAANEFVNQHNLNVEVRFDIIAVTLSSKQPEIEHLQDAFLHF